MPMNRAQTWLFTGAKGGTGTTMLTTSLAWALAAQGQEVIVLDFDLDDGQAAMHLCENNAGPTVADALRSQGRLDATLLDTLLLPCGPRLRLLAAGSSAPESPPLVALGHLMRLAGQMADWVLVDLPLRTLQPSPLGPSEAAERLVQAATRRVLVTNPSLSATYNARRRLAHFEQLGTPVEEVVLNGVARSDPLSPQDVRQALLGSRLPAVWRALPRRDEVAAQAVHHGLALGQIQPRDPLSRALQDWASDAIGAAHATEAA